MSDLSETKKFEVPPIFAKLKNYVPTEEDRRQDRITEEWKAKRREEARLTYLENIRRYGKDFYRF